jgi:hypothetical protein
MVVLTKIILMTRRNVQSMKTNKRVNMRMQENVGEDEKRLLNKEGPVYE